MQGQQQQRAPAFGLGPPGGIGASQSPSFPDMQLANNLGNFNNQQNGNNPMGQMSAAQIQAAFNQNRNNPMFQALAASQPPQVTRQLELMGMAQNQQPQNGPVNINNVGGGRGQPGQQQQQQGFQPNMGANGQGTSSRFTPPGFRCLR